MEENKNNKEEKDFIKTFVKPVIVIFTAIFIIVTISNKFFMTVDRIAEDKANQIISQYVQNNEQINNIDDKKENLGGNAIEDITIETEKVTPNDYSPITETTKKAMVTIYNYQNIASANNNVQSQTTQQLAGSGSGVIIGDNKEELWILTNQHVINSARRLTVEFVDGTTIDAYTKGFDSQNDIAVLSIKLSSLSENTRKQIGVIKFGDSNNIKSGQTVIAIGDVLNKGQAVTKGIISIAKTSVATQDGKTVNMIQIDAAINQGNSGGALLNVNGELIGIPTAKIVEDAVENIGYAIPISDVKSQIEIFCARESRKLATDSEEAYFGIEVVEVPLGVLVQKIEEHSPAYKSKLSVGDYIVQMDDQTITTTSELLSELWYHKAGEIVTLKVMRPEGKSYTTYTLTVTLERKPKK